MSIDDFLQIEVSYYSNVKSFRSEIVRIGEVLSAIHNGKFKNEIENIRALIATGDTERAKAIKAQLPAVTFSAVFGERRTLEFCRHYTSVLVIDIDKIEEREMRKVDEILRNEAYVVCHWKSPSGNGWKGLVVLSYPEDRMLYAHSYLHREAFIQVANYFSSQYGIALDASGKDIPRLCYMSYCEELLLKDGIVPFHVQTDELNFEIEAEDNIAEIERVIKQVRRQLEVYIPVQWNMLDGRSLNNPYAWKQKNILHDIYKFLARRKLSITGRYEDWVKVAYAIANTFHSVYGRTMFLKLCELDGAYHDPVRSERLIFDAYNAAQKICTFKTILYLAEQKGFKYNP